MRFMNVPHLCALTLFYAVTLSRLVGIPTVPYTSSSDEGGFYSLAALKSLVVDSAYTESRDEDGETLIPPTLQEFAATFVDDLYSTLALNVSVSVADKAPENSVFLTLGNSSEYTDASGTQTSEGYTLSVSSSGITISGASALGAWWGTRTVLQQGVLLNGSIPYGEGMDVPGWRTRGMMLDAGRHYYPPEFIVEMCSYMSFFKQNTFQLHLSDNLYNNVDIYSTERSLSLYARFRLWSDSDDVAGLNQHQNESYTRQQFEDIQSACVARGVTILPEIEAPGHALVIVQWKPEIGLSDDLSLLNISHPDTIPTMKVIWGTFMDWFHSKTIHIGADEYTANASGYNRFVNEMADFVSETGGKSTRIWGTFPPKPEYDNIDTGVSVQHWEFFEDNPLFDYILNNYSVVNSDDTFYTVNKWSGSYPQTVNISRSFNGNPATSGIWQPFVLDTKNSTNNPERSNPLVLGSVVPLWNDYGANASVYSEAYYALKDGIPALGDKQWGGDLSEAEFTTSFSKLGSSVPGQNLDRAIPSSSSTIFNYSSGSCVSARSFSAHALRTETVLMDQSGNAYDATTDCSLTSEATLAIASCSLKTPLSSKGRDYTLSLKIRVGKLSSGDATIISGADSALMLTPNLTFSASGNYYRLNSTMPTGSWINLSVVGRGNQTFASVQPTTLEDPLPEPGSTAATEEEFLAVLGINGEYFVWAPIAIEAPISQLGGKGSGWTGELAAMSLSSLA
ncbi:Uu.00g002410.m01.CDS01 [Anthostomella pinea]|uniref:beta-N-acetylhexosaminidase n=1 Tax=Anthostomella pinea TaxID=933095 RepID=A0AAI8VJJ2_9PEZI|nr:Uu.00g002410.m01.CDS01 [Anthostomella pinea]